MIAAVRIAAIVAHITYPGYQFIAGPDTLTLETEHDDVDTGKRQTYYWRKAWPHDVLTAAADPHTSAADLAVMVGECVYAELVREAAHEIAERLRVPLRVVDPHPGGVLCAGDGVGDAAVTIAFASGRSR